MQSSVTCTSTGQPPPRRALIIPSSALPALSHRMISRQSSFSVISTSEHDEFEWFDASDTVASEAMSSPSFTIEHVPGMLPFCHCNNHVIAYYEERIKSLEQEVKTLQDKLAATTTMANQQIDVWGSVLRLLEEIVTIGMNVQLQILGQLLPATSDSSITETTD